MAPKKPAQKPVKVAVFLDADLLTRLDERARAARRSRSNFIEVLVAEACPAAPAAAPVSP